MGQGPCGPPRERARGRVGARRDGPFQAKRAGRMSALSLLDYASVLIFALTGALAASRKQLDLVGFAFLACLTAVGGGTLRDVLLDRNPVFWMGNPNYILIACAAALLVFITAHLVESRYRWLVWLDSFALAVAVPAGVSPPMQPVTIPISTTITGLWLIAMAA